MKDLTQYINSGSSGLLLTIIIRGNGRKYIIYLDFCCILLYIILLMLLYYAKSNTIRMALLF